ncbi:MAG: RNA polymerase sigma-70 factor, ECF subfamily [Bacteroidetes bacterium]|nr:MAG: RNA polymerase sigma-70 factor, ECF subfamily [Bacteroidota bacterium]
MASNNTKYNPPVDIDALKRGDETAFRELFEAYRDRVYNTVLGFVGSEADAEDLTQDVFIEVFRSVARFRGDSKISTWLYRVAVNAALMHIRSRDRKARRARMVDWISFSKNEGRSALQFDHPGIRLENKEKAAVLFNALQKLPENQRTAWTLHKIEDLSYEEISGVMQTTLSSVESLMFRARQNLQKQLNQYYRGND